MYKKWYTYSLIVNGIDKNYIFEGGDNLKVRECSGITSAVYGDGGW